LELKVVDVQWREFVSNGEGSPKMEIVVENAVDLGSTTATVEVLESISSGYWT
jgi:hypothetical protein